MRIISNFAVARLSRIARHSLINNMSGKANNGDRDVQPAAAPPPKKKATIEKIYQKKTQLEHILLRPDTYIGSVEHTKELMWIHDTEKEVMVQKEISFVPGLYKIFDEILVNAADNKQRDKNMDCIKITIDPEENVISVWNNGKGIPVAMHQDEKMFVPTMIFGHLLTSSNYNDEEEKVTGGRNGYGAKLCNIFSTKFTVETASREYKKHFKQTWGSNMTKASEPKIKDFSGDDFTKITFSPDLSKFKMEKLDDDIVGLMSRRAFDIAASSPGVKVFLNGSRLPVKTFKDYIDLYIKNKEDDAGNAYKIVYEKANERWEVALTVSDRGFQQVSFVNSIATTKGGRHVDYVTDMIVKQLIEVLKKRNKGGINIRPFQVKNHMWIFVNCLIVNPTFDSQTKENMTLQVKSFGSKCVLSDKFITAISKGGIVESVLTWAKFKAQTELAKTSGKKQSKLKGIPKLEDANEAGTKKALQCTLILTEGDSAKTLAVSGLGVIGRDYYGVFPLRGKLLNVREATHKQILENAEINNVIKILGLQYKKKYNNDDDMKTLRYGKVMIMTDQDQDGSHIKGLVINFIHHNWPELLHRNFLEEFITPIVKCRKRNEVLSFFSLPEFEEWKSNTQNFATYTIKYYKGLGTSTAAEAKEYFSDMKRHRIKFKYGGQQDDDSIVLAFSKKHVEHRKEWLTNFMMDSKRRKEIGLPEKYLYTSTTKQVSYSDFVNLELVLFSNADNVRSIPSLVDGFKPGQRKVMFTCIKRNDKKEVKVAQLIGSVAERSAYHHGENTLAGTIVNLAQNFVGSNNINLLEPRGQFGTRLNGGKDSASARYIFTKMSPITRLIFHPNDDAVLKHEYDDNLKIEPVWYIPILPMLLVNGAEGIGTGWMTKIPNYNPRELVKNLFKMLEGEDPEPLIPWYKNFKGTIEDCGDGRYVVSGEIAIIGPDKIEITELPVGTWTQAYKENILEPLLHGSEKIKAVISDYKEYNTDTTVKFVITCLPGQLQNLEQAGLHKTFKLQSMINTSSMCVFDELGCLRRFSSVMDILQEFYTLRLKMYQKRKDYLQGMLEAEARRLTNQARFIMEKCSGALTVENKKRKTIVEELIKRNYDPDPVVEWKLKSKVDSEEEGNNTQEEEEEDDVKKGEKDFQNQSDVKKFDYLLGLTMWMLTDEKKNELLKQKDNKMTELDILKGKTPSDLWQSDLNEFIVKLDELEEKEKQVELGVKKEPKEKKKTAPKSKILHEEAMPSPMGRRVVPIISEDLKKKIQNAVKAKENKGKKIKKENFAEEEKDEFDMMVQSKKTLKDKIGTPEEIEKKVKSKKGKDGMKQTKLNFKVKEDTGKVNGSPKKGRKKKFGSDSEDNSASSDVTFEIEDSPVKDKAPSRRAAQRQIKYSLDSSDSEGNQIDDFESDNDVPLKPISHDDDEPKESVLKIDSDSDVDMTTKRVETSSEDLFDSLIGKKPLSPLPTTKPTTSKPPASKPEPISRKRSFSSSGSEFNFSDKDSDFESKKNKPIKKKKITAKSNDSAPSKPKTTKPKATKAKKNKKAVLSDEDDFGEVKGSGDGNNSDDSDDYRPPAPTNRTARAKKVTKYTFDSDSD